MDFDFSTSEIAELLKISDRRIRQLVDEGIIERLHNDKFDARDVAEKYYRFKFEGDTNKDYEKAKGKHETIKTRLSELKLQKMEKDLLPASQVEITVTNMIITFRNKILGLPSKVTPKLVGIKNLNQISTIIEIELLQCLQELSKIDVNSILPEEEDKDEEAERSCGDDMEDDDLERLKEMYDKIN